MVCSSRSFAYANSVFDSYDFSEAFSTCSDSSSISLAAVSGILLSFSIVNFIGIITFYSKITKLPILSHLPIDLTQAQHQSLTVIACETPKLETSYFSHLLPTQPQQKSLLFSLSLIFSLPCPCKRTKALTSISQL